MSEDSHCGNCGAPYGADAGRPRTCPVCGTTAYGNPLPVAVALQPVRDPARGTGLVVIMPKRPAAALPPFFPNADTGRRWLLHAPESLAFPLHTIAVRNWFAGAYDR